jgi:hypothetical protein
MLRIHRRENGEVVFALSGWLDKKNIAELEKLFGAEGKDRRIILDLKDMTLTGSDGIVFLPGAKRGYCIGKLRSVRPRVDHETRNGKVAHAGLITGNAE